MTNHILYVTIYFITEVIDTLFSISNGLLFWSVSESSIYKNSELKVFRNIRFLFEISNNWPKEL